MPANPTRRRSPFGAALLLLLLALVGAACSSDSKSTTASGASSLSSGGAAAAPVTVRVGYFPNVTHAPAIVGVEKGFFAKELGANTLETKTFNAGPEEVEALLAGSIDVAFLGPNPAINAYQKSNGEAIRIVAGSTSGGAAFVVSPDINTAADLKGKSVASPAARQHSGRRAAVVAEGPGPGDRHERRRRRVDQAAGQRRHARPVQAGADQRRLGARALGDAHGARGRRQGARRREDAVAQRPVRDDAHDRRHPVPQGPP